MDVPANVDDLLQGILRESKNDSVMELAPEDREFVNKILKSIKAESRGIFLAIHPDGRMQYMLLNTSQSGGIKMLADVLARLASKQD